MPNDPMFTQQRAYERRLTEHGTLRRRAVGLIAIGAGFLLIGVASHDEFAMRSG
jgi:hypothetical protein